MCVAAVAWHAHPDWRLLAIGNRDEFHDRPAAPLARWDEAPGVIAGRDLRSGGTWLGVSEDGRFALITNRRGFGDHPDPALASRGKLVTDMLAGTGEYAEPEALRLNDFNPFNLIAIVGDRAGFMSNRPEAMQSRLLPGIYGLSNGALDEPWSKTLLLKTALLDWLNGKRDNPHALFAPLVSEALPDIGLHPRQPSDVTAEARETAPFIRHPLYGTRCSTIVAIDSAGAGVITERRFGADGIVTGQTDLHFRWP